ncbi:MAG: hypothetical protein II135_02970 [Clostridia bacterium]|nr:hypothetical protein [Clostridia bacterium]
MMFKSLLKKQFTEIFRTYFYNQKKNTVRSKGQTVGLFVLFAFLLLYVFGTICVPLCLTLCPALVETGNSWLYYAMIGLFALVIGAFGSVFNTYQTLYAAKDNDLLLSMPIPVKYIMFTRLLSVYLVGLMYSAVPLVAASAIYFIFAGVSVSSVVGGIMMILVVSLIIFILSCALGYVVAKLSRKIKNKSFVIVLFALGGIAVYYVLYFKAMNAVQDLIANAAVYGAEIKNSAYILYLFGSVGTGDALSILIFTAAVLAVLALVWYLISKSFIKIATYKAGAPKAVSGAKTASAKSVGAALVMKELSKFVSSPTYMLNCGLGILMIPAAGVLLLIKGGALAEGLSSLLGNADAAAVFACALMMFLISMTDTAVSSVSLEGKSIWIPQSLPVDPFEVLRAKLLTQLLLAGVPSLFAVICAVIALGLTPLTAVTFVFAALSSLLLCSIFYLCMGIKFVNLTWTNEMYAIKQGTGVLISMFGTWGYALFFGGAYLPLAFFLPAWIYLASMTAVTLTVSALLYRWLKTKGAEAFADL